MAAVSFEEGQLREGILFVDLRQSRLEEPGINKGSVGEVQVAKAVAVAIALNLIVTEIDPLPFPSSRTVGPSRNSTRFGAITRLTR